MTLGPAWATALAATRPTVLDVICDPDVPPIPPHATFDQVKSVAGAVLHGDEDAWGFVKQGVKQKVQQYLPGHQGETDHAHAACAAPAGRCLAGADRRADRPVRTEPGRR